VEELNGELLSLVVQRRVLRSRRLRVDTTVLAERACAFVTAAARSASAYAGSGPPSPAAAARALSSTATTRGSPADTTCGRRAGSPTPRRKKALPAWLLAKATINIGFTDLQTAFAEIGGQPRSLSLYRSTVQQVFDYIGVNPNPARDRRFKLPRIEQEDGDPPPKGAHSRDPRARPAPPRPVLGADD
jgi:hypothetical protein